MIVCIVGGAGFLGRRIVRRFAQEGHEAVSLDLQLLPPDLDLGPRVRSARMDVTQFEDVIAAFATYRPDIVITLSFMRENLPRVAMKLNVLGMDNCLEASRLCGVERVVYASSIAVNGKQKDYGDRDILETDPTTPAKQYDVHKVFNEWQAKEYSEKHRMSVIGVRAANVSGTDKAIGSVDHVDCIVKPAAGQSVKFDHRDRMRCVIHGDDAAEIFFRIALASKPRHAIYNSGGESLSLGDIANMVRGVIPEAKIEFAKDSGGREMSSAYRFNNERVASEFGIQLPPYETRVRQMIESVRGKEALG